MEIKVDKDYSMLDEGNFADKKEQKFAENTGEEILYTYPLDKSDQVEVMMPVESGLMDFMGRPICKKVVVNGDRIRFKIKTGNKR